MRVLVIGSLPGHVPGADQAIPADVPLSGAGRALGWALAEQNCRAIIGSASPRTIDPYIVEGYTEYCLEHPDESRHIEVHFPTSLDSISYEPTFGDTPPNLHLLKFDHYADSSSPHRWIVSHFEALRVANVLLIIGGGVSTRLLGSYAASSRFPVVAIGEYGGSAAEVYMQVRHTYQGAIPRLGRNPSRRSAQEIVAFARALVEAEARGVHSYFLSYSWRDCGSADCIELFLRRFGRAVFRDEERVKLGSRLSDQLQAAIQQVDTFLALWSQNYESSRWCPGELDFALNSQAAIKHPKRIVLVSLDDTSPPLSVVSDLRQKGESRDLLELAMRRLIEQEPQIERDSK